MQEILASYLHTFETWEDENFYLENFTTGWRKFDFTMRKKQLRRFPFPLSNSESSIFGFDKSSKNEVTNTKSSCFYPAPIQSQSGSRLLSLLYRTHLKFSQIFKQSIKQLLKLLVVEPIYIIEMNHQCFACDKYMISDINIYVILASFSALEIRIIIRDRSWLWLN